MSGDGLGPGGPMSDVLGTLYNEVQCIIGKGHMGTPSPPPVDRHTHTYVKTLPSRNFVAKC